MLVSRRHHAPFEGVSIELDRVLAPTWIVRRVRLRGVAHDEHLTKALGRGTASERARLTLVLSGRLEASVSGRAYDLGPGDFLVLPRLHDALTSGGDDEVLEIDWDDGAALGTVPSQAFAHGSLGARARLAAAAVARVLAKGAGARETLDSLSRVLPQGLAALAAEGLPFDAAGAAHELPVLVDQDRPGFDVADQRLFEAIDATLANLGDGPSATAIEDMLSCSRRTVSRRARDLHARYGLSGVDGESWRSVRDFYRILVGAIFASSPHVGTSRLASALGYTSPEALCHAFAHAGLPSPGAIKKTPRAA